MSMTEPHRYHISEIIDIDVLAELFQRLSDVTGIATAVLDLEGNVLIATHWQDICTNFHRINPESATRCAESDTLLAGQLEEGQSYNVYRCKNGLIDVAVPIVVDTVHIGNLFTGQFFFKKPDFEYFERQARKFDFDREAYLEALSRVPVFTEEDIEQTVALLVKIGKVIAEMGMARLYLTGTNRELHEINVQLRREIAEKERAEEELKRHHEHLEELVADRTAELDRTNRRLHRDIRRREEIEKRLIAANRELEAFVYTVSHDLRTPITSVIGYAEIVLEKYGRRLDGEALEYLETIVSQGEKMSALMEDLLALAKAGHLERAAGTVSTDDVVREVVRSLQGRIAEAGASVTLEPLPPVRVPESVLSQIFDNLIGNAVRYAGGAGSPIIVGGERRGSRVRFFVRDHGPGVSEDERERIFDLFFRGASGNELSGTGVGLATVLKIARAYGGCAWVEETPGGGSTFRVEIEDSPPAGEGGG